MLRSLFGKLALFSIFVINRRDRGDRREDVYYIALSLRYLYQYSFLCGPGVPSAKKLAFLLTFSRFFMFLGVFRRLCVFFTPLGKLSRETF